MPILVVWWLLLLYWIAAIYSVSTYESFTLTQKIFDDPTNFFYFVRWLRNILIAVIAALVAYRIPTRFFQKEKNVWIITIAVFILQLLVFIPWIWAEYNWARWWLDIKWLPSIQPCEYFKLWYVLFMAWWLIRKKRSINNDQQMLISYIVINIIFLVVFCFIPDFGSALVMWVTWVIMALYAWMNRKKILVIWVCGAWCALLFGSLASVFSSRFAYLQDRMLYFVSGNSSSDNSQWIWWQNEQALAAIWWWWLFGNWYGKWLQKFGYIPEAQSDFIFAAFSEEVWFVWDIILIALYFYLMFYVLTRLKWVHDEHGKLIVIWLLSLIIVQAFINMWVNLKILPNTGLTLPFISYWWSALMVNCISLVLIYKIIKSK